MSEVSLHLLLRRRTDAVKNRKDILRFVRRRLIDIAQEPYETSNRITGLDESLELHMVEAQRISRHSANDDGKVVSPKHRKPSTSVNTSGAHSC